MRRRIAGVSCCIWERFAQELNGGDKGNGALLRCCDHRVRPRGAKRDYSGRKTTWIQKDKSKRKEKKEKTSCFIVTRINTGVFYLDVVMCFKHDNICCCCVTVLT